MNSSSLRSIVSSIIAILIFANCHSNGPSMSKIHLSSATEAKALAALREGLHATGEDQFWVSMHAAEGLTLAGYGDEVRAFIEPKLLTDKDAQHRCGIARELVRAGDKSKIAVLQEIQTGADPYGHVHAAESLYKVDEVGDPQTMRRQFIESGDIKLRLMAAGALARKGDLDAIAYIRNTLVEGDPEGLRISSWLLGRIGNADDIEPLRSQLDATSDPLIKAYVEHSLAALGDPAGLEALSRNLESEDKDIRTYAATFAGDAGAAFTQPKLEKLLDDPHLDARVRAAQSLLQLSK